MAPLAPRDQVDQRTPRRQKEPPKYDGSAEIEGYLRVFTHVAMLNGWDEYRCGQELATLVTGGALEVISALPRRMGL